MVLPNALLLPFALLPLTIFEPRYRLLLSHALEHDRMICISLRRPDFDLDSSDPEAFHSTAGIGLIRACVQLENGNSNLILQGICRVRITSLIQEIPFRSATIHPLPNEEGDATEAKALCARVLELCHELKDKGTPIPLPIEKQLAAIDDPSALADIVAHTFIADPFTRQKLLEELSVPSRLRQLISELQDDLAS